MPSLQQIYVSLTSLTFVGPSLQKLSNDLRNLKNYRAYEDKETVYIKKNISLNSIQFNYPNTSKPSINNLSLNISAKSKVGLVGATGSGKTTIVDIILGLLEPQFGTLRVDDITITKKNSRSWQRNIGYVPQHIYLSDDTIAANIAFGIEPKKIKQELVEKVSKIANIHNFIVHELPLKYQTVIGERGVRLSGGQRQRLGIARALYNNPKLLILDEATSALDNQTEEAVMDAIYNLSSDITIILIAHRLGTVKNCDEIFLLSKGALKAQGSFEELKNNKFFRNSI